MKITKIETKEVDVEDMLTVNGVMVSLDASVLNDAELRMLILVCHTGSIKQLELFKLVGKDSRQCSRILSSLEKKGLVVKSKLHGNSNLVRPSQK